jgi:O-antigen/teichoic acid export membrane protein
VTSLPTRRQRVISGARGQLATHAVRVIAQVASVSVLIASWGLHRYGDWLILSAAPTYLAFSDIGFTGAATNDMTMAAGRGDHARARVVFVAVSRAMLVVLVVLAIVLPVAAAVLPLRQILNLGTVSNATAGWTVTALGFDALVTVYSGLLYGGFAAAGRYGDGALLMALTMLGEFGALAVVALLGGGPAAGATAMLAAEIVGTVVMFGLLRRSVPWLRGGSATRSRAVLRELLRPALAAGAIPGALMLNIQGMVLIIGLTLGPASVAVFATLRTVSRAVIQVIASVAAIAGPEISRAFAAGEPDELRVLHRRSCQVALWSTVALVVLLGFAGGPLLHVWTSGKVGPSGMLLDLILASTVVDALWYTSLTVLYATNRHARAAAYYTVVSIFSLPLAALLMRPWGLDGAAASLLIADAVMLVPVLRQALPAAHDGLGQWLGAIVRPPRWVLAGGRSGPGETSHKQAALP